MFSLRNDLFLLYLLIGHRFPDSSFVICTLPLSNVRHKCVLLLDTFAFTIHSFRGMPVAGHSKVSVEFRFHRRRKTANLIDNSNFPPTLLFTTSTVTVSSTLSSVISMADRSD